MAPHDRPLSLVQSLTAGLQNISIVPMAITEDLENHQ
jgi:hypothetical protein